MQPQNERERGHQNRPKPDARADECRIDERCATLEFAAGEFHNQDRVFRREADKHDEPDLRVDVVLKVAHLHGNKRAEHGDRDAQ